MYNSCIYESKRIISKLENYLKGLEQKRPFVLGDYTWIFENLDEYL